MKFWKTHKYPLTAFFVILLFLTLRFALPAMPYEWTLFSGFRLIIMFLSPEGYRWLLWDLILLFLAICTFLAMSVPGEHKGKSFFLSLTALLLTFALTTPLVTITAEASQDAYHAFQEQQRQEKLKATYLDIREFLDDADIGYAYDTNTHRYDDQFLAAFPELASTHLYTDDHVTKVGKHVTDVILLDYDTHRVGIVYFRYGDPEFYLYQLHPVDHIASQLRQHTIQLPAPGKTFVSYSYPLDLGQYTDILALTMADGSIYAITGLSKENDLLFLGLKSQTELLNHWSDQHD